MEYQECSILVIFTDFNFGLPLDDVFISGLFHFNINNNYNIKNN